MANMMCPKCGKFQEKAETCNSCGIVIAKFKPETDTQSSGVTPDITIENDLSLKEKFQSLSSMHQALIILACIFLPVLLFLFGALGNVFVIILIAVITFVFSLWPVKKAAEWFGAESATYMHVFFAQIVAFVLAIGTALFIVATGLTAGWILILMAIGASYAKILGTSFFRGLGITMVGMILSWLLGYALALVLSGIFGVGSLFYSEENKYEGAVTLEIFEETGEAVCRCGTDKACLTVKMGLMAQMADEFDVKTLSSSDSKKFNEYTARAFQCAIEPKPYIEKKKKKVKSTPKAEPKVIQSPSDTTSRENIEDEKESIQVKKKTVPVKYEWRTADASELTQLLNKLIEVETTRETIRKGFLLDLADDIATLGKSRKTGGLTFAIPLDEIKTVKVYDKVE